MAYPSYTPTEWLTDIHLANGHAADERPEGRVRVRYNYPRPLDMVPHVFKQRPVLRVLLEKEDALIQQFCDGGHWHNIGFIGLEQRAYYWEPNGSSLARRSAIRAAFQAAAPDGWVLESINVQLQADGHSCGDWAHYFRSRLLAYCADEALVGKCTFPAFLVGEGMQNLRTVPGVKRAAAERDQRRIARRRRDALRELLRRAAALNALPWGEVRVGDFMRDPTIAAQEAAAFVNLDEDMEGDETFDPTIASAKTGVATAASKEAWLVVGAAEDKAQAGDVVSSYSRLAKWGKATVFVRGPLRALCIEGRWAAGLAPGVLLWQPIGRGEGQVFCNSDGPSLGVSGGSGIILFDSPVLENAPHEKALLFPCARAAAEAGALVGV